MEAVLSVEQMIPPPPQPTDIPKMLFLEEGEPPEAAREANWASGAAG